MTIELRNIWNTFNKALTIINLVLVGILTFNTVSYKEIRDKKIPVFVNVLLLIFLGLGVIAAFANC
jgi:phosphatidylserine synthase